MINWQVLSLATVLKTLEMFSIHILFTQHNTASTTKSASAGENGK